MSSTNSAKTLLKVLGGILLLLLMSLAAIKSGHVSDFVDPYGFIFILVGGIALVMISFSGNEVRRALMHAVGTPGEDAAIRLSVHFWEAAGRSFWMLGGFCGVLSVILGFEAMKTQETAGVLAVINTMVRSLLYSFYGVLLAVICLIPCWKLIARLQSRPSLLDEEQDEASSTIGHRGLRYGAIIGYILFFSTLILTIPHLSRAMLWNALPSIVYWPSVLVVLGGALVLMLFVGSVNSGPPLSMSFASMGILGFLIAFIRMLLGIGSSQIMSVASNLVFILSSCFTALLGMILVGAPLEDRAVRTGRIAKPSAFSRISWYGFPLLTLVLVPLVIVVITTPMPRNKPQVTEVTVPFQEQRARYEARAPQSDPVPIEANVQESHLVYRVNPVYPEQAKREGLKGSIKLTIIINEEGFVYEARGNPGNNPVLEKAAIPAVKRWRFIPFRLKDVPVAIKTTATVNFALK